MLEPRRYLQTIIETMQDGLMVVDKDGMIASVNRAMEELMGYSRDELIGSPCSILKCDLCYQVRATSGDKHCELFRKGGLRKRSCVLTRKDGSLVHVLKNAVVLKEDSGRVIGGIETLTDVSELQACEQVISSLSRELGVEEGFCGFLGTSPAMKRLYHLLASAAESEAPVLIMGESGSGKELAAAAIHKLGRRQGGPFIKVNCAALNDSLLESELFGHVKGAFSGADRERVGRFEAADGGDFFIDEIGDLPLSTQVKLLRVIQERVLERVGDNRPVPVDVRIISATNKDLKSLMAKGGFREDLYYRIGAIPIELPPLRERRGDIPLLARVFSKRIAARNGKPVSGLSAQALEMLVRHDWPGNVRELINVLEYAQVLSRDGVIGPEHLPALDANASCREERAVAPAPPGGRPAVWAARGGEGEREAVIRALEESGGRKGRAAELLGISRVTLWKKIKAYGL